MKAASALHVLALGACFVVQSGALEFSGMPGVRRAIQTMQARAEPSSKGVESGNNAAGDPSRGIARQNP
jgi:hypothetical protein